MIYTVVFVDDTKMSVQLPPVDGYGHVEVDVTDDTIKICDDDDNCYFLSRWSFIKAVCPQSPISEY